MTAPERRRLPHRRKCATVDIEAGKRETGTIEASMTVGFDDDGTPLEVFLSPRASAKVGSGVDHVLGDAAVLISLALQHGVPPEALARTMGRLPTGEEDGAPLRPATIIGAALDHLIHEAEVAKEEAEHG